MKSDIINMNRIGRTKFLAYTHLTYGLVALVYYLTFGFGGGFSFGELFSNNPFIFVILIILSTFPIKFLAQRFKDAGLSGWWSLVGLVPHTFSFLYSI